MASLLGTRKMASAPITTFNHVVLTLVGPFCARGLTKHLFTKDVILEGLSHSYPETALLDYIVGFFAELGVLQVSNCL